MYDYLNGGRVFNAKSFNRLCELLEVGKTVLLYIGVINEFEKANAEQERYKERLEMKYGDNLSVERSGGAYTYNYIYQLI